MDCFHSMTSQVKQDFAPKCCERRLRPGQAWRWAGMRDALHFFGGGGGTFFELSNGLAGTRLVLIELVIFGVGLAGLEFTLTAGGLV